MIIETEGGEVVDRRVHIHNRAIYWTHVSHIEAYRERSASHLQDGELKKVQKPAKCKFAGT